MSILPDVWPPAPLSPAAADTTDLRRRQAEVRLKYKKSKSQFFALLFGFAMAALGFLIIYLSTAFVVSTVAAVYAFVCVAGLEQREFEEVKALEVEFYDDPALTQSLDA